MSQRAGAELVAPGETTDHPPRVQVLRSCHGRVGHAPNGEPEVKSEAGPVDGPRTRPLPSATPVGTNAVYKLDARGNPVKLLQRDGKAFLSMTVAAGVLFIGTGNEGGLYRIDRDDTVARVLQLDDATLITALTGSADGRIRLATGNAGALYHVEPRYAERGEFTSRVYDAAFISRWGRAAWLIEAAPAGHVAVATRSGNAKDPDATWSPWSKDLTLPDGEALDTPAARFLQYRVTLATGNTAVSPAFERIDISYLPVNQPPRVYNVRLAPNAPDGGEQPRSAFGGTVTLSWDVSDPNGDELLFTVRYRGEDETTWKMLKEEVDHPSFDWDTVTVPDGVYRVSVEADDSPANTRQLALTDDEESARFTIDNTPPVVGEIGVVLAADGIATVNAKLDDAHTSLRTAHYSIDSQDWLPLVPEDAIFDSRAETLRFDTEQLDAGEHTLAIKAVDAVGNIGTGKVVFTVE